MIVIDHRARWLAPTCSRSLSARRPMSDHVVVLAGSLVNIRREPKRFRVARPVRTTNVPVRFQGRCQPWRVLFGPARGGCVLRTQHPARAHHGSEGSLGPIGHRRTSHCACEQLGRVVIFHSLEGVSRPHPQAALLKAHSSHWSRDATGMFGRRFAECRIDWGSDTLDDVPFSRNRSFSGWGST